MGSVGETILDAQERMKREGWCVIPDVIGPEHTQKVLDELWSVAGSASQRGEDTFLPFLDPNASNVRVFYLLEHAIFRELIQHPTALHMVKSVLGQQFLISNFTANVARPGSKSMGLHSDQSLVTPDPWTRVEAMSVVWCLTDVYFENGATLYVPGSNKWQRRSDISKNAKTNLKPFEAKAGSIVVMDGTVWHTSGANVTKDQDRALLFAYYTAPHLRQQVNWTRKLSKEVQESLSPEMEEWLGLGVAANLGEAILHLKYLDDQFAEEGGSSNANTAAAFAKSSHSR
ncbi:hypothetical protein LTR56_000709 [Elasticomyces elasticus]|nr:hypothetical protein LTR22_013603 [Elasticomyces elasticus]KAK3660333.1 hypothetical protein LTR56_000709 [Elasticomyces elasticus]KAK4929274.1 hypothetical protein LTR49_004171 [Elasticomyces elasticus]KAK5765830.1 hypothetical protein LTS12_004090 [Elasticomyces elasticus]